MTYLGQTVVIVVDLTGSVRIGEIPRREVEQGEVDALAWLGNQLDWARRHGVGQGTDTVGGRRGRDVTVGQHGHSSSTAGRSVAAAVLLWHHATDEAQVGGYRLLPGLQTLIVIR